jgi:hypothetical protein
VSRTIADALTDADAFNAYAEKLRALVASHGLSADKVNERVHYLTRVKELSPEFFAIMQRYQVLRRALDTIEAAQPET